MKVHFWGTRGSLPASFSQNHVMQKIVRAIKASSGHRFDDDHAIFEFVDRLPFSIKGCFGSNTSCIEILGGDDYIICDAGTGLRDLGNEVIKQAVKKSHIFHIFISHLHWDHIQGFPFFLPAYMPDNTINIYGCHDYLEASFVTQQDFKNFPVPLKSMGSNISFTVLEPEKVYTIGGFNIKAFRQRHPGNSYGYRFEKDGKSIVYSTDSEHKGDVDNDRYPFLNFFKNADLLIFDAQYSFSEYILSKEDWGHSNNLIAVELSVRAGVKRLCIFHNEPTVEDAKLEEFLENTRRYLSLYAEHYPLCIDLAYDGLEIEI
ncbi:MAG: MBL fold metallo-hydrolase [Syntrophorhabdaceae bacterium]|nr:MBL fold metallo-hydrolase [Syntrophorhabdaceae bacterium]